MILYAISGLGADERVFQQLKLNCEIECVQWIIPLKNENISSYSKRLSNKISVEEPFGIIAVSFGGLIAMEMLRVIRPEFIMLISSMKSSDEIPSLYRFLGKLKLNRVVPASLFKPPFFISKFIFGTKSSLLKAIIRDTDSNFAKWAVNELLNWNYNHSNSSIDVYRIHGDKDRLLKAPRQNKNVFIIKNGGHFAVVDSYMEVSDRINLILSELN